MEKKFYDRNVEQDIKKYFNMYFYLLNNFHEIYIHLFTIFKILKINQIHSNIGCCLIYGLGHLKFIVCFTSAGASNSLFRC